MIHEMVAERAKEQNLVIDLTEKKNLLLLDTADGGQVVALGPESVEKIASIIKQRCAVKMSSSISGEAKKNI